MDLLDFHAIVTGRFESVADAITLPRMTSLNWIRDNLYDKICLLHEYFAEKAPLDSVYNTE